MEVWHLLCDGKGNCLLDWTNLLGPHVLLHWFACLKWKKLWITPTYVWGLLWSHVMMIAGGTTSSTCESVGKWKCYWASLQVCVCVSLFGISELCFTSQKNVKYIALINVYSGFQEWNSRTRFFQYAIASWNCNLMLNMLNASGWVAQCLDRW